MTQLTKLGDVAAYLRAGDTFMWKGKVRTVEEPRYFHNPGWHMDESVELLNPRWVTDEETCSKGLAIVGGLRHPTMYAALCRETAGKLEPVRAENPIPGDKPQPDILPRLVKGSELRVGDVWKHPDDSTRYRVVSLTSTHRECAFESVMINREDAGTFFTHRDDDVELLSRAEPASEPASQPAAPALDADRLRREWEYLAERTRWNDIAAIHLGREWASGFTPEALTTELEAWATDAFERALGDGRAATHIPGHFLVVLQPDNPDRPIELYSEALAATAYHAKAEELWPTAAMEAEAPKNCVACDAMCASGQIECGDCRSGRARRFSNLPPSFTRTENRFRGLPPAPGVHLSPGARYHLLDETGWATPSWEA